MGEVAWALVDGWAFLIYMIPHELQLPFTFGFTCNVSMASGVVDELLCVCTLLIYYS